MKLKQLFKLQPKTPPKPKIVCFSIEKNTIVYYYSDNSEISRDQQEGLSIDDPTIL